MPVYGSSSTAGYGTSASGQLRGSVFDTWADNAWVTSITARLGRTPSGGNPSVRMGLYTTSNANPHNLVGQSAAFTVSTAMDHGAGGQVYTQSFSTPLRVSAGGQYSLAVVGQGHSLNHAMVPAASSPFTNKNLYYRNGVTGSLPSPFGYTDSSYEGNISAYVTYVTNRVPTATTSVPNGLMTSSSVTFKGNFADSDSTYGDKMLRFNYVIQTSGGGAVYDSGWVAATSAEANNGQFSRARTLSPASYRWRCRVQDQFGEASAYSAWRSFSVHQNRAPTATTSVPNGLQTSTSVNFQGTFSDVDTTITGDVMSHFRIQVINNTTKALVYNSGDLAANSTEKANKRFNRNVSLTAGIPLAWRTQVRDDNGAWSAWTAYRTFTINAGGAVDTLSGVSGKQNTQQPTPFMAVWRHANGLNATNFRYQILQNGQSIRVGGYIDTNTPNNGALNSSWATAFGTYKLPWGSKNLTWRLQARDSAGVWSDWSSQRSFSINSAPNIPTNLTPSNNAASANMPLLRCKAVDDDNDPLTVKARIKDNVGAVLQTRTMSLVSGWYQYQTTSADLAAYGTFSWDAYSYDGVLYSGESTTEANAQKSTSAIFVYALVPDVVLTSPVEGETYAGAVIVEWNSIPNQTHYKTTAFNTDGSVFFVRDWYPFTGNTLTFNATAYGWRKGVTYSIVHEIRDSNGLEGSSSPITFMVDYALPTPIDQFIATPEMVGNDTYPTAINLSWNPYVEDDFQRYTVSRLDQDGLAPVVLATITNPYETSFTDLLPPTGVEIEYTIVVTTLQGIDNLESEPASTSAQIDLESVILQNVYQTNQRLSLVFDSDREYEHISDVVLEMPWGASAPMAIHGAVVYQVFGGSFTLISDDTNTAKAHIQALRNLYRSKQTICYRDDRDRRMFGTITSFSETDQRVGQYTVDLEITETMFEEGVPV